MMQWWYATLALAAGGIAANRGRTTYLVVTLATTVAAWLLLSAFTTPFLGTRDASDAGITIRNASPSAALPLRYAQRIEALPDAHGVMWYGLQMVGCGAATAVTLNAIGGPGAQPYLAQQGVSETAMQHWAIDPLGAVVSEGVLAKCGWHIGQGVQPPGLLGAQHFDLHIVGTFPDTTPVAFVHYDYINRAGPGVQGHDMVVWYLAHAGDPRYDELLAAHVEMEFAHDFPAVSATANATQQNAWARFGKAQHDNPQTRGLRAVLQRDYYATQASFLQSFITLAAAGIAVALGLSATLAIVNALGMALAAHWRELAIQRAVGFRRAALALALLVEVLVIGAICAAIAVLVAWFAVNGHEVGSSTGGSVIQFRMRVDAAVVGWTFAYVSILGVLSALWPIARAVRAPLTRVLQDE